MSVRLEFVTSIVLEPAHKAKQNLVDKGSIVKIKSFDFSKYLDGIDFNPTSDKF